MAIHNFNLDNGDQQSYAKSGAVPNLQDKPPLFSKPVAQPNAPVTPESFDERDGFHYSVDDYEDRIDKNFHEEVRGVQVPGFHLMDTGIKNYFSGIRIPVQAGKEQYRIMNVKITGADASALVYSDKSVVGGRPQLPYLSITRTAENFDPKRYTPAYRPFSRRYLNNGKRMEQIFRPVPYLIDYTLEIWGEHKRDVENALYAIKSRFNPLASYYQDEQGVTQEVILHSADSSDASDIESDAEQHAEIKKSLTIQMEGWLPLPTKIVNTILSKPLTVREGISSSYRGPIVIAGDTWDVIRDNA